MGRLVALADKIGQPMPKGDAIFFGHAGGGFKSEHRGFLSGWGGGGIALLTGWRLKGDCGEIKAKIVGKRMAGMRRVHGWVGLVWEWKAGARVTWEGVGGVCRLRRAAMHGMHG